MAAILECSDPICLILQIPIFLIIGALIFCVLGITAIIIQAAKDKYDDFIE